MTNIARVWIEPGCIGCHACEQACPSVFSVAGSDAEILGSSRVDGLTSGNLEERSGLSPAGRACAPEIEEAAAGCPVDVIRFLVEADVA